MKTSLIYNCKLNIPSSAAYLGVPEGEIYHLFQNKPPEMLSIAELHKLAGDKIKSGERDSMWFNSELAQKDPVLVHPMQHLLEMLEQASLNQINDELCADFQQLMGLKPSIGTALEVLRIIVNKYELLTGPLYNFVERLSMEGFFEIPL